MRIRYLAVAFLNESAYSTAMQKRWGKSGFTVSQKAFLTVFWILIALAVIVWLMYFANQSVSGATLAKKLYASAIGLQATTVAHSPDNMYVAEMMGDFDTIFEVTSDKYAVQVGTPIAKIPSKMPIFTPPGVSLVVSKIVPARTFVKSVREGDIVSLRERGEWNYKTLICPVVATAEHAGLRKQNSIVVLDERLQGLGAILQARLGASTQLLVPGQLVEGDGIVIGLRVGQQDPVKRAIAFYDVDGEQRVLAQKLACLVANALQKEAKLAIDVSAAVPAHRSLAVAAQPAIIIEIPDGLPAETVANAIYMGVEGYYG